MLQHHSIFYASFILRLEVYSAYLNNTKSINDIYVVTIAESDPTTS